MSATGILTEQLTTNNKMNAKLLESLSDFAFPVSYHAIDGTIKDWNQVKILSITSDNLAEEDCDTLGAILAEFLNSAEND